MEKLVSPILVLLLTFFFSISSYAQLVPSNTATHIAISNGSWFDTLTWSSNTIPGDAAIVVIPAGKSVTYDSSSDAHIFAIQVDGQFHCTQSSSTDTSRLIFDSFFSGMMSKVTFKAAGATDGNIEVIIKPFDIEAHKAGTSGYTQTWNANAKNHFSDGDTVYQVERTTTTKMRYNNYADAVAANTQDTILSITQVYDKTGVLGRYGWDSMQVSLGIMTMGQVEIIGREKTNMVKLGSDAAKGQRNVVLETIPTGWNSGDEILITFGGEQGVASNGNDFLVINTISGANITTTKNVRKNHVGRSADSLHCYVGNMTRNIVFRSSNIDTISQRGHFMSMMSDTNIQVKNAAFLDMGRTDKNRFTDDFIFSHWMQPPTFHSKLSALGQECIKMKRNPKNEITNPRGRYSIHLHKLKAKANSNIAEVTGNVVIGNPGWAITHHDSYADISNNNVYNVTGAGIVSETGSELGFWNHNLVVDINKGHSGNVYEGVTIYDDHSFSGQGLAMKGRGVICEGNVMADCNQGIGVMNMNASVDNTDRVDAEALATLRPDILIDQWPLSVNGYSVEGDGVMPVEVPLIMHDNTIIWSNLGFKSIERDMGVNHESRSILDGFKLWGVNQGMTITYQADYSFKDVFISGKDSLNSLGMYMWKHSHNHLFDGIKMANLEYGIAVSKLVESNNSNLIKTRNNGITPWYFIDLELDNVEHFYEIKNEDPASTYNYVEHTDNPIHLSSSDISERPTTFAILDSSSLEVDVASGDFRFEIDGIITDNAGAYDMGILQAPAQGTLREGYPSRIYEFASQTKFEEYLTNNGVYKDTADNDQLYFIIDEYLPNRMTYEYTKFPIRIKINNAPNTGVYANPSVEPSSNFIPANRLISRFGTGSMSSEDTTITVDTFDVDVPASRALDGNINGRINVQQYQRGFVPIGSIAETETESEPWYELDLKEIKVIDFIDIWSRVKLNGKDIELVDANFKDFYVLVSDSTFGTKGLTAARTQASSEYYSGTTAKRRFFRDNLNDTGRYIRVQFSGMTKLSIAEIEVIGRELEEVDCKLTNAIPLTPGTYHSTSASQDGDWICFCDDDGALLLALDTIGSGAVIAKDSVSLWIGNTATTSWTTSGGLITNSKGGAIINRSWNVGATIQPSGLVKVKYFFTDAEFQKLRDTLTNHNGGSSGYTSSLSSPSEIELYKLYNGGLRSSPHESSATGLILSSGAVADTSTWVYSKHGVSDHESEFLVSSFSGGGGGSGGGNTALPVEQLYFIAQPIENHSSLLKWATASELDNSHFEIWRSYDGQHFEYIDREEGNGTTSSLLEYGYTDNQIVKSQNVVYYKLRQVDFNGRFEWTDIRVVDFTQSFVTPAIVAYPNPTRDKVYFKVSNSRNELFTIVVNDMSGREIKRESINETGFVSIRDLAKGMYLLRIKGEGIDEFIRITKR